MSTSPERCLGGSLMEEIDKELNPRDLDFESKETTCKTSDQKLSLDSIYSIGSCTPLSEDNKFSPYNKFSSIPFTKANILSSFNNQRTTKKKKKSLMELKKNVLTFSKLPFFYYLCPSFINVHEKNHLHISYIPAGTLCLQERKGWRKCRLPSHWHAANADYTGTEMFATLYSWSQGT